MNLIQTKVSDFFCCLVNLSFISDLFYFKINSLTISLQIPPSQKLKLKFELLMRQSSVKWFMPKCCLHFNQRENLASFLFMVKFSSLSIFVFIFGFLILNSINKKKTAKYKNTFLSRLIWCGYFKNTNIMLIIKFISRFVSNKANTIPLSRRIAKTGTFNN